MFSEVNAERRFCCYERSVGVPDDVEEAQPLFARATLMRSTISYPYSESFVSKIGRDLSRKISLLRLAA
jgi:hypothetical protein